MADQEPSRPAGWRYRCGCLLDQVGQTFVNSVLVCPIHREPVAEYERTARPWRGRAVVELDLEAPSQEAAEAAVNAMLEQVIGRVEIRSASSSVAAYPTATLTEIAL